MPLDLDTLNPAQREAVVNYDSPSLIIAGAGSGKTRVLTTRIAYMIEQGVAPFNILALTFTNKAAEQMRSRIAQMLPGNRSRLIRMGTFHSVFSRILRENADRIGFPQSFTIYEPSDSRNLLKTIVRELNLDDDKYKPARLASRISFAKNALVTPGAYLANTTYATEDRHAQIPEFGNIYNIYCQRCKRNGAMDFDDLLLQTNILLRDCPDVLARYQEQFRYILVDEYQDTNYAQYVIIRRLSQTHSRVCVVGDDAQSIYSFRGAKIENILSFQKDFPDAQVFKLEQNYRSTRTIVDAANSVIRRNSKKLEKNCFSEGAQGDKIRVLRAGNDREEAEMVVSDLRDKVRAAGDEWSEAVILYRAKRLSRVLEEEFRKRGIPYRIYRGLSFYDHKEIKDLMAYIRLIINPQDDEAFRRVINLVHGVGASTVEHIALLAENRKISMWETVDALMTESPTDAVQKAIVRKVADFVVLIRSLAVARTEKGLYDFGFELATKSGILPKGSQDKDPEIVSIKENVEEFLNSMRDFETQFNEDISNGIRLSKETATIEEWFQNVMLMTDADQNDSGSSNKVTLMTVHSAKGLEYKYVYIVGVEDGIFPSSQVINSPNELEEERRLFYVALTRAKVSVTISYVEMRYNFQYKDLVFSHPSCFLNEIDPQYLETDDEPDDDRPAGRGEGGSALDELRRRFDYRFQQAGREDERGYGSGPAHRYARTTQPTRPQGGYPSGGKYGETAGRYGANGGTRQGGAYGVSGGNRQGGGYGASSGSSRFGGSGSGASQGASRFGAPKPRTAPDPALVQTPRPSTEGMRRIGVRPAGDAAASGGDYAVGQRVEHPKFGAGIIRRIEMLNGDQKLVIAFDGAGEKTLLANYAKLTKL